MKYVALTFWWKFSLSRQEDMIAGSLGPTQHMLFCHDPTAQITSDESERSLKRCCSRLGATRESTRVLRVASTGFLFQAMCDASPSCCRCQLRRPSTSTPPLQVASSLYCRFRYLLSSPPLPSLLFFPSPCLSYPSRLLFLSSLALSCSLLPSQSPNAFVSRKLRYLL
ncbi:hypothetical protein B296_00034025 [Ensete ventricosum]|uniref:Uncharacterized protein n=1 Tax=Ensete ventricosum TaxID=4639 RepID=A0A427A9G8_ENSVE|nr:hypothetical protein B296_00034025 [Ensete ventricosum]